MYEWQQLMQAVVNEMDEAIMRHDDQALTLQALAARLHYSEFHATRKFREMAGMPLRTYLHQRRLAFALKEVRDSRRPLLDIALDYGFSGQESFTRAFKALYGVTPGQVFLSNGSDDILNFAFMDFGEKGAVFPSLTYSFYPVFANLHQVPYETVPLREDFFWEPCLLRKKGRTFPWMWRGCRERESSRCWPTPTPLRVWHCPWIRWRPLWPPIPDMWWWWMRPMWTSAPRPPRRCWVGMRTFWW